MADLPVVLVGPVLRRVEAKSVSVFMALRIESDVTVRVFAGRPAAGAAAPEVGAATAKTRRLGAKLHVVVVTVEPGSSLTPLTRYSYDVVVGGKGLQALGLLEDKPGTPGQKALGHGSGMLPSFVTPAAAVADLRLAHTSCRKSNGPGPDALAWLDDVVQAGLSDIAKAPQQLFLTGDQIYADDVGATLLPLLHSLGEEIVGPEKLPVGGNLVAASYASFPALRRQGVVRSLCRFSTEDGSNHLLTYGEFVAMYCLAFSPSAWTGHELPTPDSIFPPSPPPDAAATHATPLEECFAKLDTKPAGVTDVKSWKMKSVTNDDTAVKAWRDAVPKVARVLANVPTYMIFDDHEITDDWNLTAQWNSRVVSAPMGRMVVRNGLMAYTAFQAWGNDPATFSHPKPQNAADEPTEDQLNPNEKLLKAMVDYTAAIANPTAALADRIDLLLGIDKPGSKPKATFHFKVDGTAHQVRVMDSRTRRGFSGTRNSPPQLLGGSLDTQIPAGPFTDGKQLLVLISPAPVLFPALFDTLVQPAAAVAFDLETHLFGREDDNDPCKVTGLIGAEHVDVEGWGADELHREALLRRLGTYRRVVILSGDVHFASTLRLDFWAKGDDTLDSRIVQCTASAARNQPGDAYRGALRTLRIGQQLLRGVPVERLAWETGPGVTLPSGGSVRPGRRARMRRKPAVLPADGWPAGSTTSGPPDWRWRLEVVRDERPHAQLPAGAPTIPMLSWDAGEPLQSYAAIAASHQQVTRDPKDPLRLLVFRNNVGLVRFSADGGDVKVAHALLSSADDDSGDEFTEHDVPFAPSPAPVAPVLRTV